MDILPLCLFRIDQHRIAQLRQHIHSGALEREPSALHPGKVQQLLHHFRQALGLVHDDVDATLYGVRVCLHAHGLRPALDGGERRAQFVGNGRDKLVFHVLRIGEFVRHLVDGHAKIADLVAAVLADADRKVPFGVLLCGGVDLLDGSDDGADKIESRHHQQQQHSGTDCRNAEDIGVYGLLDLIQRCHHPDGVILRVHVGDIHGERHNGLAALFAHPIAVAAVHGRFIVGHGCALFRGEPGGRERHSATGTDRHKFHLVLVGEVLDGAAHFRGKVDVGVLGIAAEDTGHGGELGVQILLGCAVVIVLHDVDECKIQHRQHQGDDPQVIDDPAACDRASGTFFCAMSAFICHSTYIHSPRWS